MKRIIVILLLISTSIIYAGNRTKPVKPVPEGASSDLVPTYIDTPNWPMSAVSSGQEGWVQVKFELNEKGKPVNIRVGDSSPKKMFDKAVLKSVKKWRFDLPIDHEPKTTYQYVIELRWGEPEKRFEGDVSTLSESKVTIKNEKLIQVTDKIIKMSFDYEVSPYHNADRLYGCQILFFSKAGPMISAPMDEKKMCFIHNEAGSKTVNSYLPDTESLELADGDVNYVITVMQRVDDDEFKVIGNSKVFKYD